MRGVIALSTDNQPTSSKKVCWESLEKLCQVRLFAAEDAPLLSGTTLQDLYQAKETKFLHVVKPVHETDMPPGFVSFAAKPTGVGASSNASMDTQVFWRIPEKFFGKPGWQVAAGGGSFEDLAERKRELLTTEAIYSSFDVVPPSPGEPQEVFAESENHVFPEVPLFCIEDDDEMEEGCTPGISTYDLLNNGMKAEVDTLPNQSPRRGSGKNEAGEKPGGLFSASTWQGGQPEQETNTSSLAESDPNVAAAAAAAYAVLKAKERGALVDHDLLIKILTNPILIKTLLAANQDLPSKPRDFLRAISEDALKGRNNNELASGRGTSNALCGMGSNIFPPSNQPGCRTNPTSENMQGMHEASSNQPWNTFGHHEASRTFLGPRVDQLFYGRSEAGQGKGTLGLSVSPSLAYRQDVFKDLVQQHGLEKIRNEGQLRGFSEMEIVCNNKLVPGAEMLRGTGLGSFSQLGVGSQVATPSHGRNDGFSQSRFTGEMSQSRFQKPCLYFNTPKGCRRGTTCFYLHDSASEPPYIDQSRSDFFQFQQSKRPKFGAPEKD